MIIFITKKIFYNKILKVELISPISNKITSGYKTFSKEQKIIIIVIIIYWKKKS